MGGIEVSIHHNLQYHRQLRPSPERRREHSTADERKSSKMFDAIAYYDGKASEAMVGPLQTKDWSDLDKPFQCFRNVHGRLGVEVAWPVY
jgi:hypothetical protein